MEEYVDHVTIVNRGEYYTLDAAAWVLGIHYQKLLMSLRQTDTPYLRIGHSILVRLEDVRVKGRGHGIKGAISD